MCPISPSRVQYGGDTASFLCGVVVVSDHDAPWIGALLVLRAIGADGLTYLHCTAVACTLVAAVVYFTGVNRIRTF